MSDSYYDVYNPDNNYKRLLFRAGKGLQSRELNELQLTANNEFSTLARASFSEGSVIEGGHTTLKDGIFTIEAATIFARGYTHSIAKTEITVGDTETFKLGINITERIITELEDPSLRDPAVNTRNYNQPGAHRLRITATWVKESEATSTSSFYAIHTFELGQVVSKAIVVPEYSGLENRLAQYDNNANGSYVISGFSPKFLETDVFADTHYLTVSEGSAHVEGYPIKYDFARRIAIPFTTNTMKVNNEPVTFSADGWYSLRWAPIASIGEINGQRVATRNIIHGNFTGAKDLLPESPVVSIVSVKQGTTTYQPGVSYVLNGDFIDWSPSGAEPSAGSTYEVTFVYQATIDTIINEERTKIYLEQFQVGSVISVDYNYYIPRIDVLTLTREGSLELLKGTPSQLNPVAPNVIEGLQLAEIYLLNNREPIITSSFYRAYHMSDIQQLANRVNQMEGHIAHMLLNQQVATLDSGFAKKNMFVDPFLNNASRDVGQLQSAVTSKGLLFAPSLYQDFTLTTQLTKPLTLNFTERQLVNQDSYSNVRKINEFERALSPAGTLSLSPSSYVWTAQTTTINNSSSQNLGTDVQRFNSWTRCWWWQNCQASSSISTSTSSWSSTSSSSNLSTSVTPNQFMIPQISINLNAGRFNGNELVDVDFDGVLVSTITADANGYINRPITLPANVPAGSKQVQLAGRVSGVIANAVFVATPQILVTTITTTTFTRSVQTITTTNVSWIWNSDPVAQTFTATQDGTCTSIELQFDNSTTAFVDCLLCEVTNGYPNVNNVLSSRRIAPADVKVRQWVKVVFDTPARLRRNVEYAIVFATVDTNLKVRIAELGKWDAANNKWLTEQSYLRGVFFNSSNGSAWSAVQTEDLMFRVNIADYTLSELNYNLGTTTVEAATDLVLNVASENFPTTLSNFTLTLLDRNNETYDVVPYKSVEVKPYSGRVKTMVRLRTTDKAYSPIVGMDATLSAGTIVYPATYVSKGFPFTGDKLVAVLDIFEPSGSQITVEYKTAELQLTPGGENNWAPTNSLGGGSIGSYMYIGSALHGEALADVIIGGSLGRLTLDPLLVTEAYDYVFGDFDSLLSNTLYIQQPVLNLTNTWTRSGATSEYYYGDASIKLPGRVSVGGVELTKGTAGSLSPGQFAYGNKDSLSSNRLYIRLPAALIVEGEVSPAAYGANNTIKLSYDPDSISNTHVIAREWRRLTRISSEYIDDGFVEARFETPEEAYLDSSQLRVTLDTLDTTLRPVAKNLRAYVI